MKSQNKRLTAFTAITALLCATSTGFAQSILKTAGNFALLGGTAVTSDGTAGTVITNGNVGSAVAVSGFSDLNGGAGPGVITSPGLIIVSGAVVGQAILDLGNAKVGLAGMASSATMSGVDLGGKTLAPGVYTFGAAATQNGALVLDAQGKNNVFWVFQIGTTLTTGAGATVTLINPGSNGGADDGIFWVAQTGGINFGTNNRILGNYLAATTISATTSTNGTGGSRALSQAGVTLINDQINAKGGPAGSDWTGGLTFSGSNVVATTVPSAGAPVITSATTAPATVGAPFATYLIAATGSPTTYAATGLPAGLTVNTATGAISGTPTTAGTSVVTLTATNSSGTGTATLTITAAAVTSAPVITSSPTAIGAAGSPFVTYPIVATGLPTSYSASGLPAGLSVNTTTGAISGTPTTAGTYVVTLTATNAFGSSSSTLTLTVGPGASSRITNFSARAVSGPGDQTLIMGFIVAGDNKNLLVRGIGPSLGLYGISNPLADPLVTLFDANNAVASNDDWSTNSLGQSQSAAIAAMVSKVGAFALPAGSKDSSLLFTVNNGAHTTGLLRPNSTTGVALTEIYDTDTAPGARLVNVSARMNVTPGEGTLIAGFIIAGTVPKTVLIRGIGPTLSQFAVGGVLADPQIAVYAGSTLLASDDNWEAGPSTAAQIINASAQVGAFALPTGSKDAVLLMTLQPGLYSVVVTGVANTSGVALVEIYDVN